MIRRNREETLKQRDTHDQKMKENKVRGEKVNNIMLEVLKQGCSIHVCFCVNGTGKEREMREREKAHIPYSAQGRRNNG